MTLSRVTSSHVFRPSMSEMFRGVWQVIVVAASIVMLAGCTSSNGGPTGPSAVANTSVPLPSLTGTWTGTYRIVECAQHDGGPLANICASLGASYPFTLELQQSGPTVTGRYALANVWFDLASSDITADRATLRGAGRIDSSGVFVDVTWSLSVAHPALGGTAVQEWAADAGGGATLRANVVGQVLQR